MKCPKKHVKDIFSRDGIFVFEMPQNRIISFSVHFLFSYLIFQMGNGAFQKNEHKKVGHFEKKHVISLKTENEPKIKLFDFGALRKQMHMPSREKDIFHMLFGAFHNTCRIAS